MTSGVWQNDNNLIHLHHLLRAINILLDQGEGLLVCPAAHISRPAPFKGGAGRSGQLCSPDDISILTPTAPRAARQPATPHLYSSPDSALQHPITPPPPLRYSVTGLLSPPPSGFSHHSHLGKPYLWISLLSFFPINKSSFLGHCCSVWITPLVIYSFHPIVYSTNGY